MGFLGGDMVILGGIEFRGSIYRSNDPMFVGVSPCLYFVVGVK